jgi:hypothetical protein
MRSSLEAILQKEKECDHGYEKKVTFMTKHFG